MSDLENYRAMIGFERKRVIEAKARLEALVDAIHPPGSEIRWERPRGFPKVGKVLKIVGDKLLVQNTATGRDYHIDLSNIYGPWEETQ